MSTKCLICYCNSESHQNSTINGDTENKAENPLLLNHLSVIFILRNIFQVPVTQLSNYLNNCPNVDQWINVCENCNQLVRDFQAIYNDLIEISRKFEETKHGIIDIVKKSYDKSILEAQGDPILLNITDECRQFINGYEYQRPINPFTDGDLKARQLLNGSLSKSNDDTDKPVFNKTPSTNTSPSSYPDPDDLSNDDDNYEPDASSEEFNSSEDNEDESQLNNSTQDPNRKLSKYQKNKNPNKYHECPHCPSIKYLNKSNLFHHFKNKHPNLTPPPKGKAGRRRHLLKTCKVPVKCPHCGKQFPAKNRLQRHIKLKHLRKFNHYCVNCGGGQPCKKSLRSHENLCLGAEGGPKLKCPENGCPVVVSMKIGLETHFRDKHGGRTCIRCPEEEGCGQEFYTELGLDRHIKREHKETRPFKCDLCGVGFKWNQKLKEHLKRDHGEDGGMVRLICDHCGDTFSTRKYLRDHVEMQHEGQFKLRCGECGRGYGREDLLKVHLFKKHGVGRVEDMKWRCGVEGCGRVFWKKGPLEVHRSKEHGGEECGGGGGMEWTCEECGKQFYAKQSLDIHRRIMHVESKKCEVCGVEFKCESYVARHMKKVHKIFPPLTGKKRRID